MRNLSFCIELKTEKAETAAAILSERLKKRNISETLPGYKVTFIDEDLDNKDFEVEIHEKEAVIKANSVNGFLCGAGYLLRSVKFAASGFTASDETIKADLKSDIRGMYFAAHFHNYYHVADIDEIKEYIADLALLGVNWLMLCFPFIDLYDEDSEESRLELKRHEEIISAAHELGMKCCELLSANMTFKNYPKNLGAKNNNDALHRRGNTGPTLCMAMPESVSIMENITHFLCNGLKKCGIDMILTWPYDEGGCGCDICAPWGAKGFIKSSKRIFEIAKSYFPEAVKAISTWCFDTPYEGEWEALHSSLEKERWCDIILADSHTDFPEYPLLNDFKDVKIINFPEISMWGLMPWGGWGAAMLPGRFERLYNQAKEKIDGGFLYSEGIFEDINVAVIQQFYREGEPDISKTLAEYANYEFGLSNIDLFKELVRLVEKTHTEAALTGTVDTSDSDRAFELAEMIDKTLPEWGKSSWRWRIIYLRTMFDARRYRIAEKANKKIAVGDEHGRISTDWSELLAEDSVIREGFGELIKIFHCRPISESDELHLRVRPVLEPIV